jgi:outer membrane receptor protein involved in Fe transport
LILLWAIAAISAALADGPPYAGRAVQEVLDEFRAGGFPLVYSTRLVTPALTVAEEPLFRQPTALVREILEPHGLTLRDVDGVYFVIRQEEAYPAPAPSDTDSDSGAGAASEPLELEEINVSASRYVLFSNSQFFIDQRAVQALPDLGEDPIRSAQRLPGAAAGGLSSRSHFRGGEHNETAIYLNGLKLLDPFHIRDYHSIFSSIDARAISGVEAYTGGFPVAYGDQLSGVLLLDTRQPEEPLHTELGLSFYNASILNSGFAADGRVDWLVSARRSNLDLWLDDSLGKPDYADLFAELGVELGANHRLSVNALYADDQVVVTTESDPAELEQSISDTQSTHLWLSVESQWTPSLSSTTVLSYSALDNRRRAEVNDPERMIARVFDQRDASIYGLSQDWRLDDVGGHALQAGFELRRERARYDYRSAAEYRGFYEFWPGIENPVTSAIRAAPEGHSMAFYLSDRWRLTESTRLLLGLRWDRQTYTEPQFDGQLSPRISLLQTLDPVTELRLTWGRYSQSQAIQELQVEDGQDRFFAPQRADHWIAGIRRGFGDGYRLRAEVFYKDYRRLKPRFENLFDPLALIPELAPDRVRVDPASARAAGIELTLEYRGREDLDGWVTYSLARVEDRIGGAKQLRSWDQRHAVQAAIAWRPGPWEIGAAVSIHTGWPTTGMSLGVAPHGEGEEDPVYFPIPGPRNAERLGTFAQLDFRISRDIAVRKGRLSAFLELTNATNRRNDCCIDYDIDEDADGDVFLDRTVEHWLPLIPAVGMFWEF